ncbi:MutS-related protein [Flexithrix dorotheae]|uniref:MutS-related protein n=1 Tax=Flexithrix dorotheae TaxID=70993 RepID=UPI00036F7065|nr:hypothetical protein [Flexithrix dorotheae]
MPKNPLVFFQENIVSFQKTAQEKQSAFNLFSTIRTIFFILALVLIVYLANEREAFLVFTTLVVSGFSFALLIKKHNQIRFERDYFQNLVQINKEEIHRLEGNFSKIENDGAEFQNQQHNYSGDLDIFGHNSLFQLINRTSTSPGTEELAKWLKSKSEINDIYARQESVKELADQPELRQDFQAKGVFGIRDGKELEKLIAWVNEKPHFSNNQLLVVASYFLPVITVALITLYFLLDDAPEILWIGPLLVNFSILGKIRKGVSALCEETVKSAKTLKTFVKLIEVIEDNEFKSGKLKNLQHLLSLEKYKTSDLIKKLSRVLTNLEARENAYFYVTVNVVLLFELFWAIRLERWRSYNQENLKVWMEAIAEFDALSSLAGFAYANPEYVMPLISSEEYAYKAEYLGHPLIPKKERVSNDFRLTGQGKIIMITGSNMSGKSTFLRTLGVNAVLAFAGAPVAAKKLELSLFNVFTSMRTQDSLEEHTSGFYAELKRIKMLLSEIATGENVFYLMDEVLKGTNSHDRHYGVKTIIKKLVEQNCFGLLSTHDLSLSELSNEYPEQIINKSFNCSIKDNKLSFDHKLHDGVCQSFSASKLMEGLGIV